MRILDLFSGVGGFSLAAHWAGMETVAFCEQDKFCQKVLAKNFPGVPIFDDIKTLKGDEISGPIDIICGGVPCQPWSFAGQRKGKDDDRHLWPEMLRVIKEIRPKWVVVENVVGLISLGLDQLLSDLETEGYTWQTLVIPACAVGAWHRRNRVWIIANSNSAGHEEQQFSTRARHMEKSGIREPVSSIERQRGIGQAEPRICRDTYGVSGGMEPSIKHPESIPAWVAKDESGPNYKNRIRVLGNSIVPQLAYQILKTIKQVEDDTLRNIR